MKGADALKRVARVARPEHAALMNAPPVAAPATPSMHEALLLLDKPSEDPSPASSGSSSSNSSSSSSNSFEGDGRSKVTEWIKIPNGSFFKCDAYKPKGKALYKRFILNVLM